MADQPDWRRGITILRQLNDLGINEAAASIAAMPPAERAKFNG